MPFGPPIGTMRLWEWPHWSIGWPGHCGALAEGTRRVGRHDAAAVPLL